MPTQNLGRRAEARARMETAILAAGRHQLAERGAAALSLREIARSIGVASSAVYRYIDSRDALLTALLVDAYTQLANAVDGAVGMHPPHEGAQRLRALAFAMREWALHNPEQWGLIYGTPVPGYEAPQDVTSAPGTRVMGQLLGIMRSVEPLPMEPPAGLGDYLRVGSEELGQRASTGQCLLAVQAWCTIVGTISMEIFGQLGPEPRLNPSLGQAILETQLQALTAHF